MVKVISLNSDVIKLGKLSSRQQALKKHPKLVPALEKTAVGLGITLAALLNPAAAAAAARSAAKFVVKRPIASLITIPTVGGVLLASQKARTVVKTALDPRESVKRGKKLAEIIEDPSRAEDVLGIRGKTIKEKIITGAKAAGLAGAVVGGALAVGVVAKKAKEFVGKRKEAAPIPPGLRSLGFTDPRPVGVGGVPIVPAQPKLMEAPQSTQMQRPIQNIIQIAVR